MINVLFGRRSNLSVTLSAALGQCVLISSNSIESELNQINFNNYGKVNFILNQFHPSNKLFNIDSPEDYIKNAITSTAIVLEYIKINQVNINKLIYTSSSSVYGDNKLCTEGDPETPINIHSSLKLANEKLVENFCKDNMIDFTIARIFNMYGGNDNFSIISKIIHAAKVKSAIKLINNGNSVRDYIHIDDVVLAYMKILQKKNIPLINIASSEGQSVKALLKYLASKDISIKHQNINKSEIHYSVGNNSKLIEIIGNQNFIQVKDFLF